MEKQEMVWMTLEDDRAADWELIQRYWSLINHILPHRSISYLFEYVRELDLLD